METPQVHRNTLSASLAARPLSVWDRLKDWVDKRAHLVYPAPSTLVLVLLFILPIAYTVYLSFHNWNISATQPPRPVGWDNYVELVKNERFRGALVHTFYYSLLAVVLETVLGTGI